MIPTTTMTPTTLAVVCRSVLVAAYLAVSAVECPSVLAAISAVSLVALSILRLATKRVEGLPVVVHTALRLVAYLAVRRV
jgi:hypothetical protein